MPAHHALLVDDDARNLSILERLLTMQGMQSLSIPDPRQLDLALPTLPAIHVVFLDLELPAFNGYEVLARLRQDARLDGVPIIACTVHISERETAHERGFDGFIGKPLDAERFPDQLARILRGEPVWEVI
ncbi:MAG: response regulator [Armatimonadetes bacterium]|nr:response regulator [Anaerolineae bacterium]